MPNILTDAEQTKIGKIARDNKFDVKGLGIIYPEENIEKLKYFIKSYRFFHNLTNVAKTEPSENDKSEVPISNLREKILDYLIENKNLYSVAVDLNNQYDSPVSFGRNKIIHQINLFLMEHRNVIDDLIDETHSIGKKTVMIDPEETTAYY